jgi:hypothetical protein
LATRWARTSDKKIKKLCDKHGKPFVRLPGGYNPDQVAFQILGQAKKRLQAPKPKEKATVKKRPRAK